MSNRTERVVTDEKNERDPFKISVVENPPFGDIMNAKYITSNDFCKVVSDLFKTAYSDFHGTTYEVDQQGVGSIALWFNHNEIEDDDRVAAITREIPDQDGHRISNETVRRVRAQNNRKLNGDRYYLTDEGKEGLDPFIMNFMRNRSNGKIDWKKITAEVSRPSQYYNQPPIVLTKISLIDPVKLASMIYGTTDMNGDRWEYGVRIMSSMPQMISVNNFSPNYMLAIERVSEKEVIRLANLVGLSPNVGVDIIR